MMKIARKHIPWLHLLTLQKTLGKIGHLVWTLKFVCLFLNLGIKNEAGSAKGCVYKQFYHEHIKGDKFIIICPRQMNNSNFTTYFPTLVLKDGLKFKQL